MYSNYVQKVLMDNDSNTIIAPFKYFKASQKLDYVIFRENVKEELMSVTISHTLSDYHNIKQQ